VALQESVSAQKPANTDVAFINLKPRN